MVDPLRLQAIENLTEQLQEGEKVGHCDLFGLIESELDSSRFKFLVEDVQNILLTRDEGIRDRICRDLREGLIERYLDSHPELVEEEMARFADECEKTRRQDAAVDADR